MVLQPSPRMFPSAKPGNSPSAFGIATVPEPGPIKLIVRLSEAKRCGNHRSSGPATTATSTLALADFLVLQGPDQFDEGLEDLRGLGCSALRFDPKNATHGKF